MLWTVALVVIVVVALVIGGVFGLDRYLGSRPQDLGALPVVETMQGDRRLRLLVPATEDQKGHGLSGQESLPEDTGLLLRAADGDTRIMMFGMRFALDLVWLDGQGRVVHVVEHARTGPWPLFHASPVRAEAVLELPAGQAAGYGLDEVGAVLTGQW